MEVVCEECFTSINVRQSAIGKRYRCKVCGNVSLIEPFDQANANELAYAPVRKKRTPTKSRSKKKPRRKHSDTSTIRGVGFGCLYMIAGVIAFGIITAFAAPLVFQGPDVNYREVGRLCGLFGIYVVAPIAGIVGFIRHRRSNK